MKSKKYLDEQEKIKQQKKCSNLVMANWCIGLNAELFILFLRVLIDGGHNLKK